MAPLAQPPAIWQDEDGKWVCEICDVRFSAKHNAVRHVPTKHRGELRECGGCHAQLTRVNDLERHRRVCLEWEELMTRERERGALVRFSHCPGAFEHVCSMMLTLEPFDSGDVHLCRSEVSSPL